MTDGPARAIEVDRHWNTIYCDHEIDSLSWFQETPDLALSWIRDLDLAPEAPIVDVGAGASSLVDSLLATGHQDVTVLDVAGAGLDVTRRRLGERAGRVHWITVDVLEWTPARCFVLWHDRAVLHFLTDPQDQRRYAALLADTVADHGYALLAGFAPDGPTHCSGLPVVRRSADEIAGLAGVAFTAVRTGQEVHRTPSGADQSFAWVLLRRLPRSGAGTG